MTLYLHCPRCRLAIKSVADYLALTNCPRCLAREAISAPLFASPLNGAELHRDRQPVYAGGLVHTAVGRADDDAR